jgi:SAM-dependent methyltransferase
MELFDGPAARLIAKAMARGNREAEAEAIAELDPAPDATVLAIGFGPGVGLKLLAPRVSRVVGVDPSRVMVSERRTRNASNVAVHCTAADALPLEDAGVDGVIAVNSMQLWEPFDASVAEVARVLRPGGRLVTLTHDWAMEHHEGSVDRWLDRAQRVCEQHGLADCRSWRGQSEHGKEVFFVATRRT